MGLFDFIKRKENTSATPPTPDIKQDVGEVVSIPSSPFEYQNPRFDGWENDYFNKLPEGIRIAEEAIVRYFEARGEANLLSVVPTPRNIPSVQHLALVFRGNVYSVLVEFVDEKGNYIRSSDVSIQINVCEENDMIPCIIPLDYHSLKPLVGNCHLIHSDSRLPISIEPRNGKVAASCYEIQTLGLYLATESLKKQGLKIIQACDIPSVQPNIVYENEKGERGFALVVTVSYNTRKNKDFKIYEDTLKTYPQKSGIYMEVFVVPPDKEKDCGEDSPLSEKKKMIYESPNYILYRESPLFHSIKRAAYIEDVLPEMGIDTTHKIATNAPDNPYNTMTLEEDIVAAWNKLDVSILERHLSPNFQYNSAWVSNTIESKEEYLEYLRGKFRTLREEKCVYLIEPIVEFDRSCIRVTQGNGSESLMDYEVRNGLITKMFMRPPIDFMYAGDDWENYAGTFYDFLPKAIQIAGQSINEYVRKLGVGEHVFSWIQTNYCHPSFQHLCFRLGNNVYSVIIGLHGFADGAGNPIDKIVIPDKLREIQLKECSKNNLIPCVFPICAIPQMPLLGGTRLIHTETSERIELSGAISSEKVPMSEWEVHDMGISVVLQYMQKEGFDIDGYCNLLEASPQIFFTDREGKSSYVIVNTISENTKDNVHKKINHQLIMNTIEHNGYFAKVGLFPAGIIAYDGNGKMLSLSEMDNMNNPKGVLFRGIGVHVFFGGLEDIEKIAADEGTSDETLYKIH